VRLDSPENVITALKPLKVGDELDLALFRDGKRLEVKYKLPERPLPPGDVPGQATVEPLNRRTGGSSRLRL
jgi:hypothetical protein